MAIKGVSMAESHDYILKADEGHPDNITKAVERRIKIEARGGKVDDGRRGEIEAEISNSADHKPTVFKIGNLTKADKVRLGDLTAAPTMHGNAVTMTSRRVERAYEAVQRGLVGWENFLDENGNQIAFERGTAPNGTMGFSPVVAETCMNALPLAAVHELADEILRVNGMSDQMVGNSGDPLLPSVEVPSENGTAPDAPKTSDESEDASE